MCDCRAQFYWLTQWYRLFACSLLAILRLSVHNSHQLEAEINNRKKTHYWLIITTKVTVQWRCQLNTPWIRLLLNSICDDCISYVPWITKDAFLLFANIYFQKVTICSYSLHVEMLLTYLTSWDNITSRIIICK